MEDYLELFLWVDSKKSITQLLLRILAKQWPEKIQH